MTVIASKVNTKEIVDWAVHIGIAVVISILIVAFVAQRTIVYNYSMEPTLHDGDNLIVEKISPKIGKLKRGDIVTIEDASIALQQEGKTIIKRIVALENDEIEIKDGNVYVNGNKIEENYINGDYTMPMDPAYSHMIVPEGYVYVLGDNRKANIIDSRVTGPVDIDKVTSRAVIRVYPFNKFGSLK